VHAASIARSCARLAVRRIRRTPSQVAAEYDGGHWARIYRERAWERASSLEAFLVGSSQQLLNAKVDGRTCRISRADYNRHRLKAMASLVERNLGDAHDLVELGAGYGYNLFLLSLAFPERRFVGLDISPTGVAAAREIAAHFGLEDRIEFDVIDLVDPHHPNFAILNGRVVLTHFCLEQLPIEIGNVLRCVSRTRPHRVMHIEPCAEVLSIRRPADWANLLYVRSQHYQTSLLANLRHMRDEGKIELIRTDSVAFSPTLQHSAFMAVWRPTMLDGE